MNMGMMGGLGGMQGMFKDAGLGNMMGSMLGGQGLSALGNPNMMKCKYFNLQYTFLVKLTDVYNYLISCLLITIPFCKQTLWSGCRVCSLKYFVL